MLCRLNSEGVEEKAGESGGKVLQLGYKTIQIGRRTCVASGPRYVGKSSTYLIKGRVLPKSLFSTKLSRKTGF